VRQGARDGDRHRDVARIRDGVAQYGRRDSRGVGVERHERRERGERDPHRQLGILELDARDRVLADEPRGGQTRQAGEIVDPEAPLLITPWVAADPRSEHAVHGDAALGTRVDGEAGVGGAAPLRRRVDQLPIAQLAAGAERHGARPDAAERERRTREGRGDGCHRDSSTLPFRCFNVLHCHDNVSSK
jgi:hypothetical protein